MREYILEIAIMIIIAVASFEGGYILAKTQDSWNHEFKYTQLNTKVSIIESQIKEFTKSQARR